MSIKRIKIVSKNQTLGMRVLPGEEMKTVIHYLRIYVKSYAIVLPKTKTK